MAAFAKNLMRWTSGRIAGSPPDTSPPPALPMAPTPDTAAEIAAAERRRKRGALSPPANNGTLLTGPSGLETPATTQRATLLGGT